MKAMNFRIQRYNNPFSVKSVNFRIQGYTDPFFATKACDFLDFLDPSSGFFPKIEDFDENHVFFVFSVTLIHFL